MTKAYTGVVYEPWLPRIWLGTARALVMGMRYLILAALVLSGCAEPRVSTLNAESPGIEAGAYVSGNMSIQITPQADGSALYRYTEFNPEPYGTQEQEHRVEVEARAHGIYALRDREASFCQILIYSDRGGVFFGMGDSPRDADNCPTVLDVLTLWAKVL